MRDERGCGGGGSAEDADDAGSARGSERRETGPVEPKGALALADDTGGRDTASGRDDGRTSALWVGTLRGAACSRISCGGKASGEVAGARLATGAEITSRASACPQDAHVAVPITA